MKDDDVDLILDAWIGNMANPNEVLGFLHAFYGAGAVLAPLIATTMITKGNRLPWYYFYYVMVRSIFPRSLLS
jgi:fucose permease